MSEDAFLTGNTYHCRDVLKVLYGARWNPARRVWMVPAVYGEEAQDFVDKHGFKFRGWELTRDQTSN